MTFLKKVSIAKTLIAKSIKKYPNICVACSWGKDSMVLLHLIRQITKDIPVITIMTPFKPLGTREFKDEMVREWKLNYHEFGKKGERIKNPDECCQYYKVEPLKKALKSFDAWFSGVRKTEGITRNDFDYIEKRGNIIKINPILDFTEKDIWRYLALYGVPVNPLYKLGYRSLGCIDCSDPEQDENEPERTGRWKNTPKQCQECGIHSQILK